MRNRKPSRAAQRALECRLGVTPESAPKPERAPVLHVPKHFALPAFEHNAREVETLRQLAFGRILRLASRPYQPGDELQYERARRAFLSTFETWRCM